MTLFQRFRLGNEIECLAVREDDESPPYSRLDDIQETFPDAKRFKVNGVTLNFLTDMSVICAAPVYGNTTSTLPTKLSSSVESPSNSDEMLSVKGTDLSFSNLSLQSFSSINTYTHFQPSSLTAIRSTASHYNTVHQDVSNCPFGSIVTTIPEIPQLDTPTIYRKPAQTIPAAQLPTEIIFAIGEYLTRPSVLSSIMVCRHWSEVLLPFVWSSIFKTTWHHRAFPIRFHTKIDDPRFDLCYHRVKLLEWYNNTALMSIKAVASPGTQMSTTKLASLITKMPNLNILSLHMESHGPEPSLFEAIRPLQNLKTLKINMPESYGTIPIETMFPLFARLDELHVEGSWYQPESDYFSNYKVESWKVKRLTIGLRKKKHQMFLVHNEGGKPGRPHMMTNVTVVNQKKWFSTREVVGYL
ncbi:hypothetical protein EC991_006927 [Linnemannia zychae]|nr:hypothetical protein EC991_006927 [Linnemannia zychae]